MLGLSSPCGCDRRSLSCPCTQAVTRKVRILDVCYNASNNELVSFTTLGDRILMLGGRGASLTLPSHGNVPSDPILLSGMMTSQVRTQTLVKNAIIQVDATPFKQWYQTHYGMELGLKGKESEKVDDKKVRKLADKGRGRSMCAKAIEILMSRPCSAVKEHMEGMQCLRGSGLCRVPNGIPAGDIMFMAAACIRCLSLIIRRSFLLLNFQPAVFRLPTI